ncbi:putative O-methyltransferase YrrM [Paenibacillus phyllosphaerae]|uniref:Putative O-methyltransferase YrrM n=1 Tax=Paenibacillus phyllosphaerae TaxID=274593 RepID=A0A7W5AX27_9BACL|nr:O-methyltransferase [Paenibacillus phyllosphaerae]MBB3109846.1 putative O-methyltransferase YrrM [Paenibacillus phyllosphaerae]
MDAQKYVEEMLGTDPELDRVLESIRELGMPEISVAPGYGRMLTMLVQMSKAKDVLEIGALGGYSGICLARGLQGGGSVTSLELLPNFAEAARSNMEAAGFGHLVDYRIGDAKGSLAKLAEEGRRFDFFFIDADKEGYPVYLDWALKLANPGAVIVGDNTLLRGRIYNADKNGPSVVAMREFNRRMLQDERLRGTLLPGYDGLTMAVVK